MKHKILSKKRIIEEKLKLYPRVFEKIYTKSLSDPRWIKEREGLKFKDIGKSLLDYRFKKLASEEAESIWKNVIRYFWLSSKISKRQLIGKNVPRITTVNHLIENSSPISLRRTILFPDLLRKAVEKKAPEMIFDFLEHDPWEEEEYFKFPYEHIGPLFLIPVYELDIRVSKFLLDRAEKNKMYFAEYLDFVANFAFCYNQEEDKDVFELVLSGIDGLFVVKQI